MLVALSGLHQTKIHGMARKLSTPPFGLRFAGARAEWQFRQFLFWCGTTEIRHEGLYHHEQHYDKYHMMC